MVDILHRVGIKSSSLEDTYKALTTREGLSAWWTNDTKGEGKVGGVLRFRFGEAGGFDMKVLKHQGWKEPVEFMHHCSTKWGVFLMSLKSLLETRKGAPAPNDVKIDNWN